MPLAQALLIEERGRLQLSAEDLWRELAATCDDKDKLAEALEFQTHVLESLGAYTRAHTHVHTHTDTNGRRKCSILCLRLSSAIDVRLCDVAVSEVEAMRASEQGNDNQLLEAESHSAGAGGKPGEQGLDAEEDAYLWGSPPLEAPDTRTDTQTCRAPVESSSASVIDRVEASGLGGHGGEKRGGTASGRDTGGGQVGDGEAQGGVMYGDGQESMGRSGGGLGGDGKRDLHLALRQLQELVGRWKNKDTHLDTGERSPLEWSNGPSVISATNSELSSKSVAAKGPGPSWKSNVCLRDAAPTRVQHWLRRLGECVEEEEEEGGMEVNHSMVAACSPIYHFVSRDVEVVPGHAEARQQKGSMAETVGGRTMGGRETEVLLPSDGDTLVMFKRLSFLTGRHAELKGELQVFFFSLGPQSTQ